jgi:hypothetical protein
MHGHLKLEVGLFGRRRRKKDEKGRSFFFFELLNLLWKFFMLPPPAQINAASHENVSSPHGDCHQRIGVGAFSVLFEPAAKQTFTLLDLFGRSYSESVWGHRPRRQDSTMTFFFSCCFFFFRISWLFFAFRLFHSFK